ncbi:M18 family aminopeptidase [Cnuibacter physcomitrellae]|uniref:M18 family aminopeptidase n=1 Tax=Cnuibacter physcomitrellae TaxID=1619308 RepID=A0A1X9LNW0_9MICO|nr:M18 family aminopeptidase [Cnuibacter physcomitrellae]ARJ05651.1 M18 family aminopeptidase [Cnuibacter physcomitrellae]GGI36174.1 M18 family aminopeptidase [Cnuibacter physcomitrellae]
MQLDAHIDDLAAFVAASPSSYHAAHEVARRLQEGGWTLLAEEASWPVEPGGYVVVRDGAVIAWRVPDSAHALTPFRLVGTHTDSPGFKLKPQPTIGSAGWLQAAVEVYGGPLLTSWLDREIELAGRLVTRGGDELLVRTGPFFRIPQLAVHLDRTSSDTVSLDRQRHTQPVFGVGDVAHADLLAHLAGIAGIASADLAGYDVLAVDSQPSRRFGLDQSLFASARLDNLSSVHSALVALLDADGFESADGSESGDEPAITVLAAFDHEELGSESRSGASGPFLEDVLRRIRRGLGADEEQATRALAASWLVSSDAGHSIHPNYPEKHDPHVRPLAGRGPLLKINANQRYTTDAHGAALWARSSAAAGVPFQEFVSNNTVPCGSTIGPLTATRLGIRTVDVGVPLLSMHSARELAHVDDLVSLSAALGAFYRGA